MTNIGGNMVIKKILALSIFSTNLILNGANPDIYNEWFGAASNGDLNKIKELISQVDINGQDDRGRTALMQAAFFGHADILEFLLQQPNININAQDHKKYTALSLAASVGRENIMKILLKVHHIDVNTQNTITGNTPLIQASKEGHENIVNLLLNIPTINLNIRNLDGFTGLMLAVLNGREVIAKRLLNAGADPNITNNEGKTALDFAKSAFKPTLKELINEYRIKQTKLISRLSIELYSLSRLKI